jgi:hypothetical protein
MTARNRWLTRACWAAAAALSATAAVATPTLRLGPAPVSSAVYPDQEILLDFDHAGHLGRGLECAGCHVLARTSGSPADNLIPPESACGRCHSREVRAGGRGSSLAAPQCRRCHPSAERRVVRSALPPAHLTFSHARHDGEECATCHTRVAARALATSDDLPGMQLCLRCHDGRRAGDRCATCHPTQPDGRIQTSFESGLLTPPSWMHDAEHDPQWASRHEAVATARSDLCAECHQQHECLACHDGEVRPRDVHPGDWLAAHDEEARAGDLRCQSCHRAQSFCRTCHLRSGVSWRSPIGRVTSMGNVVHEDPDWAASVSPRHGREARRTLETCASCHAGNDCVRCHAFVNPHPPGFSRRCGALVRAGSAACASCHASVEGLCE